MPDLLKNMYNYNSLHELAIDIRSVYNSFPVNEFLKCTMDENWENLELKARVRKISMCMGKYLPSAYKECLSIPKGSQLLHDRITTFKRQHQI